MRIPTDLTFIIYQWEDHFRGECVDYPGCKTAGKTWIETADNLNDAVAEWLESNSIGGLGMDGYQKVGAWVSRDSGNTWRREYWLIEAIKRPARSTDQGTPPDVRHGGGAPGDQVDLGGILRGSELTKYAGGGVEFVPRSLLYFG